MIKLLEEEKVKSTMLLAFFCHIGVKALTDVCVQERIELPDEEDMRRVFWDAVKFVGQDDD